MLLNFCAQIEGTGVSTFVLEFGLHCIVRQPSADAHAI
jgi:hypothetical protein